eukprot:365763-Chlamydomonas_euryale.AAC.3
MASEEDEEPVNVPGASPEGLVAVLDPLDGSRNIEVSIPTGTIFGAYRSSGAHARFAAAADVLQPGTHLLAAGYILRFECDCHVHGVHYVRYSSACILVISFGSGVHGFTLDPDSKEFVLTNPSMKLPPRGQELYLCFMSLDNLISCCPPSSGIMTGRLACSATSMMFEVEVARVPSSEYRGLYSSRYVCSLVADFHRTLVYGGWAGNPREHLRLVYEANPLAFLAEQVSPGAWEATALCDLPCSRPTYTMLLWLPAPQAGGKGSNGISRILDIQPARLHQRVPLFLGSRLDIEELESYGNVQQLGSKKYDV